MKRRKRRAGTHAPGWAPANAVAWCALHNRGMNSRYMHVKHCVSRTGTCRHLRWECPGGDARIGREVNPLESPFYRENLEGILAHTGGAHTLNIMEVGQYTGIKDRRTVVKHFPYFRNGRISAETLAKCLSSVPQKGLRRNV